MNNLKGISTLLRVLQTLATCRYTLMLTGFSFISLWLFMLEMGINKIMTGCNCQSLHGLTISNLWTPFTETKIPAAPQVSFEPKVSTEPKIISKRKVSEPKFSSETKVSDPKVSLETKVSETKISNESKVPSESKVSKAFAETATETP